MARMSYDQARADHEYLWETYAPAEDMTGAYVDQDDLARLLKSPTKATARDCYCDQIHHWFQVGPEQGATGNWRSDSAVFEIAERHNCADHITWEGAAVDKRAAMGADEEDD